MSVSDRHLNCLVPHKLLDCPQVNPSHDQPTGKGMTQAVPREVFQTRRLHSGRLRRNALHPPYPQLVSPRRTKATEAGVPDGEAVVKAGERSPYDNGTTDEAQDEQP